MVVVKESGGCVFFVHFLLGAAFIKLSNQLNETVARIV